MNKLEQAQLIKLIEQSRAGDRQAQEKLVAAVQNRVYFHCKKMLKNEDDAMDATQDVLIAMLTSLDKLRQPAAFWGWVNGITANRCKHMLTQGTKEWQIPEDEEGNSLLDDVEDLDEQVVPDKALDNDETKRLMKEIIDALPAEQKMCVLFYYYDEMTTREIAEAMNIPEGTVKSRLNHARKSIKEGVEDLAKKGTKLYGISPLPFLAYFLRQYMAAEGLSPTAAAALTQGTMVGTAGATAGAAGTTAAAGGVGNATGTTVTGAATAVGAKAAGAVSTKIVAVALAGTLAVGGLGTAAYVATHREPEPTPEPTPTAVMAVVTPTPTPEPTPEPTAYTFSDSGTCGENTWWGYDAATQTLVIGGTGDMDNDITAALNPWKSYKSDIRHLVIEDGVTSIGRDSFFQCTNLTDIIIPSSVTTIGSNAFYRCTSLTSVVLPYGVTTIESAAFHWCRGLTSIIIPDSVVTIGEDAFTGCASLTGITLPSSVTTLDRAGVFGACSSLMNIFVDERNQNYADLDGVLFDKDKATLLTYPEGKSGAYTIPEGVTTIGISAFSYCGNLTDVIIPNSVTEIGILAFSDCTGLTSITIPRNVTVIGESAFSRCANLSSITFSGSTTAFDPFVFENCPNLTIHAPAGSDAETYATRNNIPFEAI